MKMTNLLFASAALALGFAAPAYSQNSSGQMNHSAMSKMSMSAADMNMMMSCKRMSKTALMKNKRCMDMMKMHPKTSKMSRADMVKMSACMKMSKMAMMKDRRCASMMKMHHDEMMMKSR